MGSSPLLNLVYFSSVSKAAMILAEYSGGDSEVEELASQCLEQIPQLHSRFTHTIRSKMFNFLMEGQFVYFAVVDEALGKPQAFIFLESVRDEFNKMLKSKGEFEGFSSCCFRDEFRPVYRRLVAPLVGLPRVEKERLMEEMASADKSGGIVNHSQAQVFNSPAASLENAHNGDCNNKPLLAGHEKKKSGVSGSNKKKGARDQVTEVRDIGMENSSKASVDHIGGGNNHRVEVVVEGSRSVGGFSGIGLQKSVSFRNKGQQVAQRMWWSNVRLVLIIDVVICAILFAVWLGICHGFQCISDSE